MSRPRTALILIAFLAFISLGLPDGVLGVAWPSIRHAFGLPVSQLGSLLVAGVCGYLVSSFSSGHVVRRLGVGRVLLFSSVVMVGASAGYALAPVWPVMVVLGVFAGLGAGAIDSGMNAYAARHFSPRLLNWMHAFYGVGATMGPLLMTGVLTAGLTWRWGYGINAGLLAVMSGCFLFTLKLWDAPDDSPSGQPEASAGSPGTLETFRRPVVWLSVVLFFLYTGVEVTAGQWTYSLFTESRHVAPGVAGVWVGVYWGSLTLGRVLFGVAAAHLPPLTIVRGAMLTAPLGALLIWADVTPLASFLGLSLMGFCFAPMFPLLISLTPGRAGGPATQQAVGFQMSAASLGAAGVPTLAGILARKLGLEIIGPVLLVATVLLLVVHEMIARAARGGAMPSSPRPSS